MAAGPTRLEDLGAPIQKLIMDSERKKGGKVDQETLDLLSHITVRQLAKIYESLGQEQDPDTMIAWLKERGRKTKKDKEQKKQQEEERKAKQLEREAAEQAADGPARDAWGKSVKDRERAKGPESAAWGKDAKAADAGGASDAWGKAAKDAGAKHKDPEQDAWRKDTKKRGDAEPGPPPRSETETWDKVDKKSFAAPAAGADGWGKQRAEQPEEEDRAWAEGGDEDEDSAPEDDGDTDGDEPEAKPGDSSTKWSQGAPTVVEVGAKGEKGKALEQAMQGEDARADGDEDAAAPDASQSKSRPQVPIEQVNNPEFLKFQFFTRKWNPGGKRHLAPRIWVANHFDGTLTLLNGGTGDEKSRYDARRLLQLEKQPANSRRARLNFLGGETFDMQFPTAEDRERFYECVSAMRPSIRVRAAGLHPPDERPSVVKIDGTQANLKRHVPNPLKRDGQTAEVELNGTCNIRLAHETDEQVKVWFGSYNAGGKALPADLSPWIPAGTFDVYAVAAQECRHSMVIEQVKQHLQKDYILLADMNQWEITLGVFVRKRLLFACSNVEGTKIPTADDQKCGRRGGVAVSFNIHDTSLAFLSCHFNEEFGSTDLRNHNSQEVLARALLASQDLDLSTQFHHVFLGGDLGYRIDQPPEVLAQKLQQGEYRDLMLGDELLMSQLDADVLPGFKEETINFPPTFPVAQGTTEYNLGRPDETPAYRDRVLVKSWRGAPIVCHEYRRCESGSFAVGGHLPVYAAYELGALRPHASCFLPAEAQTPRPQFHVKSIRFTEWRGDPILSPEVVIRGHFINGQHRGTGGRVRGDALPQFMEHGLPQEINSVSPVIEWVERQALFFVFRDRAAGKKGKTYEESKATRKADKGLVGVSVMELCGGVLPLGEVRERELPVIRNGEVTGTVIVAYSVADAGAARLPGSVGAEGAEEEEAQEKPTTNVVVRVVGARELAGGATCNPFCEVKLRDVKDGVVQGDHKDPQKRATKVVKGTREPAWDEPFTYRVRPTDAVRVSVFNKGTMGKTYLGKVDLLMSSVLSLLEPGQPAEVVTHVLSAADGKEVKGLSGEVDISIALATDALEASAAAAAARQPSETVEEAAVAVPPPKPDGAPREEHRIVVHVFEARELPGGGACQPFCEAKLRKVGEGGKVHGHDHPDPQKKTLAAKKGADPEWDARLPFRVLDDDAVRVSVFTKGPFGKKYLGKVDLVMGAILPLLVPGKEAERLTHAITAAEGKEVKGGLSGEIDVGVAIDDDASPVGSPRQAEIGGGEGAAAAVAAAAAGGLVPEVAAEVVAQFPVGASVEAHSLQGMQALNGARGTVLSHRVEGGADEVVVRFAPPHPTVGVRPANLRAAAAAAGDAAVQAQAAALAAQAGDAESDGTRTVTVRRAAGQSIGLRYDPSAGMLVTEVREGHPAEQAGVRPGWRILHIAGRPVKKPQHFDAALAKVGEEFTMHLAEGVLPERYQRMAEVSVVVTKGRDLAGANAFCEIKLRRVVGGVVQGDHPTPQKKTTKVSKEGAKGSGEASWDEEHGFRVCGDDAVRVSVFSKGRMGKAYLGKADLLMGDVLPKIVAAGAPVAATYPLSAAEGKKGAVKGELDVSVRLLDAFDDAPAPAAADGDEEES